MGISQWMGGLTSCQVFSELDLLEECGYHRPDGCAGAEESEELEDMDVCAPLLTGGERGRSLGTDTKEGRESRLAWEG